MPFRQQELATGRVFHVYNRGCNRQRIFFDDENYSFFLRRAGKWLLGQDSEATSPTGRSDELVGFCLMPNHFHLLLRIGDAGFETRMQSLCQSYSKAINKRHARVGPLFQGRFKAVEVESDDYLLHLSRYIHLNPVAAGLVEKAEDWPFSSYRAYLGLDDATLVSSDVVLNLFSSRAEYRTFVESRTPLIDPRIRDLVLEEE